MNEYIWEKARRNQVERERRRLIKLRRLRFNSPPIVMVKASDGSWKLPSLRPENIPSLRAA